MKKNIKCLIAALSMIGASTTVLAQEPAAVPRFDAPASHYQVLELSLEQEKFIVSAILEDHYKANPGSHGMPMITKEQLVAKVNDMFAKQHPEANAAEFAISDVPMRDRVAEYVQQNRLNPVQANQFVDAYSAGLQARLSDPMQFAIDVIAHNLNAVDTGKVLAARRAGFDDFMVDAAPKTTPSGLTRVSMLVH
jgi:hypothetical protein